MSRALKADMERAVLLHGKPSPERWNNPSLAPPGMANWFPWVSKQLLLKGVIPWVPHVNEPQLAKYDDFAEVLDVTRVHFDRNCVAVGHSFGGFCLPVWLSENSSVEVAKIILVDPWGDPDGKYDEGRNQGLQIDPKIADRVGEIVVLYSSDDDNPGVDKTIEIIEGIVPVRKRDCPGYGHFMIGNSMSGPEFPELVEEILSKYQ